MMVTEDEARKKWCPHARLTSPSGDSRSWNRVMRATPGFEDYPHCIASECMAWRWDDRFEGAPAQWVGYSDTHGYCGLAGKAHT